MSIARVKTFGWAANEKLTSGQQNLLDINVTYALDKRSGQTDILASDVTVNGDTIFNGTVDFYSTVQMLGSTVFFTSVRVKASDITFDHAEGTTDVSIKHTDKTTNGATGDITSILGQNETGLVSTGGAVQIRGGTGTLLDGAVVLYSGASERANFGPTNVTLTAKVTTGAVKIYSGGSLLGDFGPANITIAAASGGDLSLKCGSGGSVIIYASATQLASLTETAVAFQKRVLVTTAIASGVVASTFAATTTLDFQAGNAFYISSSSSNTTINATNPFTGSFALVSYTMGGAGSYTITWSGWTFNFGSLSSQPSTTVGHQTVWLFHIASGSVFNCISRNVYT